MEKVLEFLKSVKNEKIKDEVVRVYGWQDEFDHHLFGSAFKFLIEEYKQIENSLGINVGCATRYSGERPESEPETGALCNFLRFNSPTALMTLHTQGKEIYYKSGSTCPTASKFAAVRLARLTGYTLSTPVKEAAFGGLTDFCIQKLGIPAFTIECGRGRNPLPPRDLSLIYASLREALFTFPTMF